MTSTRVKCGKENGWMIPEMQKIAGPVQEIPFGYGQILKDGGGFREDVNGGYLPEDLVLVARREETAWVHSAGVHEVVPMQECKDAITKLLELI